MEENMHIFKRMMAALLALAMVLALAGCGGSETAATEDTQAATEGAVGTYSVTVRTKGGMAMSGLDVYIYADDTLSDLKQYGQTNEEGVATFQMAASDSYAVQISGAPKGYQVAASYSLTGTSTVIELESQLITGESLAGASLGLGDVMYDFSVTTPDGTEVTLSEMLKEKDMVLLNFWYTTCTYCVAEFPYMEEAYQQYQDKVGIIAVNPMEDNTAVQGFQAAQGLTFPMAACSPSWSATFAIQGYPTSIIIDRYGVISLIEVGGITSLRPFISIFETFTAEDYTQKLYGAASELVTAVVPTYAMDTSENVSALLGSSGLNVTYRPAEEELSWPFIETEYEGETCLKASNQQIDSSYAILYADVELKAGQAVGFDYLISSELGNDVLHVIVENTPIYAISGNAEEKVWERCYPWVALEDGVYEVALCYLKDGSTCEGDDTAYIKNLRVVDGAEVDVPTYIPRLAAVTEDGFDYTYADIVLNDHDGFYHVGTEDGPLLLADLMNLTQFNEEQTVWGMVDDGKITVNGHNYYEELVDYCTLASNSALNGICTVNEELGELLKIVADVAGFEDNDNEWLKICKYYEAYGSNGEQLQNPILGLDVFCPLKATLGKNIESNGFYYDRPLLPRGKLAEFIPDRSGAYRITTRSTSIQGIEGWLVDENMEMIYVYEGGERMYDDPDNISMVYYMEAGKPYYIDICYWDMYETGTIYYDIEYLGPTYQLFRTCAPGYFTYDSDATGDSMYYLITAGIDIVLNPADGYYYEDWGLDANGNQRYGSAIYAEFMGTTGMFSGPIATVPAYNEDATIQVDENGQTVMITGMIDQGSFDFSKDENDMYILSFLKKHDMDVEATDAELRELWGEEYDSYAEIYALEDVYKGKYHGTGPDLTEEISTYLDKIITTGAAELYGTVKVDARLAEILQLLMDKYTFQGVEESWLKLSYYYQNLAPQN